ncbi:hypothetical protein [Vibrio penaeicida]|uniref:Uncharacterized protein n=1 Tax=Vibrio penaeicida TaxID=104609 RepID=A0AAV5NJ47_9VIBR|nr:hypothetical protein [Vibrio penaeicida]RTZ23903.1 hypothetical protein EKN09_06475 [Vibrio penaeicida]GLQ70645.1 hypothetical protein GCM10007932_00050 [Vibrio penaeicida]
MKNTKKLMIVSAILSSFSTFANSNMIHFPGNEASQPSTERSDANTISVSQYYSQNGATPLGLKTLKLEYKKQSDGTYLYYFLRDGIKKEIVPALMGQYLAAFRAEFQPPSNTSEYFAWVNAVKNYSFDLLPSNATEQPNPSPVPPTQVVTASTGLKVGPATEGLNTTLDNFDVNLRLESVTTILDLIALSEQLGTNINIYSHIESNPKKDQLLTAGIQKLQAETGRDFSRFYTIIKTDNGPNSSWVEDARIMSRDGKAVYIPADISRKASYDAQRFIQTYLPKTSANFGLEGNTKRKVGLTVDQGEQHNRTIKNLESTQSPITIYRGNSYIEGGNLLSGTMQNGNPYAVVGTDSVVLTTQHMSEKYLKSPELAPSFSPESIAARISKLAIDERDPSFQYTLGKLTKIHNNLGDQALRTMAREMLAKEDLAKDIIAEDIGLVRSAVAFVPQPGFHLDMKMRPLENGDILVNDEAENQKLLSQALRFAATDVERSQLNDMLEQSRIKQESAKHYTPLIKAELRKIGLNPISSPGVFEGKSAVQPGGIANFMNSVLVESNGQKLYLTNHARNSALRKAFQEHMYVLGFETKFLGESTPMIAQNPWMLFEYAQYLVRKNFGTQKEMENVIKNMTEAEFNLAVRSGGLDCLEVHYP